MNAAERHDGIVTAAERNYGIVTAAYWGFTLTDGALRIDTLRSFLRSGNRPPRTSAACDVI